MMTASCCFDNFCNFDQLLQILRTKQGAIFVFYTRLLLSETEHLEFVHKVSMSSLFAFDVISSAFGGLI